MNPIVEAMFARVTSEQGLADLDDIDAWDLRDTLRSAFCDGVRALSDEQLKVVFWRDLFSSADIPKAFRAALIRAVEVDDGK